MKHLLVISILLFYSIPACYGSAIADSWTKDIMHQPLPRRPKIEARYTDATRTALDLDAQNYRLVIELKSDLGQRIRSLRAKGPKGFDEILASSGIYLEITDSNGIAYSSLNSKEASRINIYRRGPYYIETHWLDIQLADLTGKLAPVRGEVVLYSYPEKTHVGVILHVTGMMEVKSASIVFDSNAETCAGPAKCELEGGVRINDFVVLNRGEDNPTCALIYPALDTVDDVTMEKIDKGVRITTYIYNAEAHGGTNVKWDNGNKPSSFFEIFPMQKLELSDAFQSEIKPLLSTSMTAKSGRTLGYDPIRGCYKIQTDNLGDFSYHYEHPNKYEAATFSIQNDSIPRKIYVMHETRHNPGFVECGVLLDEAGRTLPIMVQISKNFSGEKEEPFYNPNDIPFSETFFPLYLEPEETRTLTSLHLYQNWGSHSLKQFSSLGAWTDYYHMSTGVTETTCYVPFLFGGLDGVAIADLRPMSQEMWKSQPQHDNVAGHSFLRYQGSDGQWHFIEYTGTTFRSTGPNWADVSLSYVSDDNKAKVKLDIFELPQTDELRNFIHMRVDFLEDIDIKDGDLARNVRLLNIASWVQQMRYTHVAYGGPIGEPTVVPIKLNDDFTLAGAMLPTENGFAAIYPDKKGANAYIVRRFEGRISGESVAPGVSVIGQRNGDTTLMLVPVTKAKKITAGDWIDIELFIMPYGGGTQDWKPAQKAAFDFGLNAPRVTSVSLGKKIADFPTRIALDENEVAEFNLTGGANYIPIIVEGAKDYICKRIYLIDDGKKVLVDHAQKGERDGYQVFAHEDGTFGWVFLVMADGNEHRYRVE
jgi:hypothetical protein